MITNALKRSEHAFCPEVVRSALRTVHVEILALEEPSAAITDTSLGKYMSDAAALIISAKGRLIITGLGKSGHVGRKIAATLASTGTPSMFMHPSEASHGGLGMVSANDVVLALSWSVETSELGYVIAFTRRF